MTNKGDASSTGSQDYDSILFSSPLLVRNIVISGRRKLPGKNVYVKIEPELVDAAQSLTNLGVTREQLIEVSMLLGTDYNLGIKGVGPKTALKLVREYGTADRVLKEKGISMEVSVDDVRDLFLNPKITEDYEVKPKPLDKDKITRMLVDDHDFSAERVQAALRRIDEISKPRKPVGLDQWL
jgi:flap endonuclease-1